MKKDPKDLLKTPDKKTIAAIKKKEKEINLKIGKELNKIFFPNWGTNKGDIKMNIKKPFRFLFWEFRKREEPSSYEKDLQKLEEAKNNLILGICKALWIDKLVEWLSKKFNKK